MWEEETGSRGTVSHQMQKVVVVASIPVITVGKKEMEGLKKFRTGNNRDENKYLVRSDCVLGPIASTWHVYRVSL